MPLPEEGITEIIMGHIITGLIFQSKAVVLDGPIELSFETESIDQVIMCVRI